MSGGAAPGGRPPHSLAALVAERAREGPARIALVGPGREPLTYAGLAALVDRTLARLNELGIGPGDTLATVVPNGPEAAASFICLAAGATAAPLNPAYQAPEFEFYLSDLRAKALVIPRGLDSPARAVAARLGVGVLELSAGVGPAGSFDLEGVGMGRAARSGAAGPDDVALVLHTSGTTSRPKLVPLTQRNLLCSAGNIGRTLALTPEDRCLNVMPLFHIHGLAAAVLATLQAGASVVCTPGFLAPMFFDWLAEFQPTWYSAVPTMHQSVLARAKERGDAPPPCRLRFVRSSSAALPPQVMAALEAKLGAPVIEAYGMTEAAHQMASNPLPPGRRKPGSVGRPAGPEITVGGERGARLGAGQVGEILIRGPNVTGGYAHNPEANASAFSEGWFHTGDQGYFDADGYLFITGRIKELINRGGEKISPREVDETLMDHPAVAQALSFAIPDERLGEEIGAAVVLRPGGRATPAELREFAAGRLIHFKVPRRIVFLDELPKGPTGKPQRIGLAARLGITSVEEKTPAARAAYQAPATPTEKRLADIWASILRVPQVGRRDDFFWLGGDSILATQMMVHVREAWRADIPVSRLLEARTLESFAAAVDRGGGTGTPAGARSIEQLIAEIGTLSEAEVERQLREAEGKGGVTPLAEGSRE